MDKRLIADRFSKAIGTYTQEANVQREIAEKMIRLLRIYLSTSTPTILEFGCGTGIYSRMLLDSFSPSKLLLNDLCPEMEQCLADLLQTAPVSFLPGDAEQTPFPPANNLITSCSALQWFEAPEHFFERCHTLLEKDGYLAFSTFGQENMKEVRSLTGLGLPYRSQEELATALSERGFEVLHAEEELLPLSFEDPIKVLYHLKRTGVNGLSQTWTRRDLLHFCQRYAQEFTREGAVWLTYHAIYLIAQKKTSCTHSKYFL